MGHIMLFVFCYLINTFALDKDKLDIHTYIHI